MKQPKITPTQALIIVTLADNNLNVLATARRLFMHRNNVNYHIEMIHRKTRKNPLKFYELLDLLPMAEKILNHEGG